MANINLTTGIVTNGQFPVDGDTYFKSVSEVTSKDINNEAFGYYEGMVITILGDDFKWEWREEKSANESGGLLSSSFTYPNGLVSNGIDYSNRVFNFFKVDYLNGIGNVAYTDVDNNFSANQTFQNDVSISGSLFVSGDTVQIDSQIVTADTVIVMNDGEVGNGVTNGFSGLEIDRGSEDNFFFGFDEVRDSFVVGEVSNLSTNEIATTQVLATREDNIDDQSIVKWDDATKQFVDSGKTITDLDNIAYTDVSNTFSVDQKFNEKIIFSDNSSYIDIGSSDELLLYGDSYLKILSGDGASIEVSDVMEMSADAFGFNVPGTFFSSYLHFDNTTASRAFQFPDASGTIALTSDISSGVTLQNVLDNGRTWTSSDGFGTFTMEPDDATGTISYVNTDEGWGYVINAEEGFYFTDGSGNQNGKSGVIAFGGIQVGNGSHSTEIKSTNITENRSLELPDASGTIALTSDLNSYLPLTGGTLTNGSEIAFYDNSGDVAKIVGTDAYSGNSDLEITSDNGILYISMDSGVQITNLLDVLGGEVRIKDSGSIYSGSLGASSGLTANRTITIPDANGTIALVDTNNNFSVDQTFQGKLTAPNLEIADIVDDHDLTTKEYVESLQGEFELKTDSTTSITLSSADKGKVISADSSSAITFTIDTNSLADIGDIAYVDQMGSGEVTFVASGVTLQYNASRELKTDGQFSRVAIHKTGTTTYRVFGELKQG